MFSNKNDISGENERHIHFIRYVAKPLFESWGYEVKILRAEKDYLDCFHHVIRHPRKHPHHKGQKYGFAISGLCSVKRDCKLKPIQDFLKTIGEPVHQYVGICADEKNRLQSIHANPLKTSLLEKYGYTEAMARDLCIHYGLLSPTYELSKRGGCWFCPNAKLEEHRELRKSNPLAWKMYMALEQENHVAHAKWNPYTNETLAMRDDRLSAGDHYQQLTIFDFLKETDNG